MLTQAITRNAWEDGQAISHAKSPDRHWDLGFMAMLFYLVIEYARLPAMYPILGVLSLGKVAVGTAALGYFSSPREKVGKASACAVIDLVIVMFLAVSFLSCCLARYQELAWATFGEEVRWALIYFLIGRIVSNSWRFSVFVFLLLLLNAKLAQYVIRTYFSELASGLPGMFLAKTGVGAMAGGFFANGEDLGLAMVVALPIAGYFLLAQKKRHYRAGIFGILALIFLAILFCGSRGAVVGAAMVALAAWARKPRIKTSALLLLVFLPAVVYLLPDASKERMRSAENWEKDKTASHRILLWKAGMRMFPDYPILGVGPGNYPEIRATSYAEDDPEPKAMAAHNTFVEVLTELGLMGMVCFLALLVLFLRVNAKTRMLLLESGPEAKQSFEYCLVSGLDLALVGFLTSGFFHSSLYYPHLWVLLGLSVGLHTACVRKQLATATKAFTCEEGSKFALSTS